MRERTGTKRVKLGLVLRTRTYIHVGHAEPVLPLHLVGEVPAEAMDPAQKHLRLPGGDRRQRKVAGATGAHPLASPAGGEQRNEEQHGGGEEDRHGS